MLINKLIQIIIYSVSSNTVELIILIIFSALKI